MAIGGDSLSGSDDDPFVVASPSDLAVHFTSGDYSLDFIIFGEFKSFFFSQFSVEEFKILSRAISDQPDASASFESEDGVTTKVSVEQKSASAIAYDEIKGDIRSKLRAKEF